MSAEAAASAAAAVVTIPQYASQLPEARDPLQGALGNVWAAQPLPTTTSSFPAAPAASGSYEFGAAAGASSWSSAPAPAIAAEAPSNGTAIAGFVLGLLGFSIVGLFVSIAGLRKARQFDAMGMRPAGRVLARWGVAFSVIGLTFSVAVGALYALMGPTIISYLPL